MDLSSLSLEDRIAILGQDKVEESTANLEDLKLLWKQDEREETWLKAIRLCLQQKMPDLDLVKIFNWLDRLGDKRQAQYLPGVVKLISPLGLDTILDIAKAIKLDIKSCDKCAAIILLCSAIFSCKTWKDLGRTLLCFKGKASLMDYAGYYFLQQIIEYLDKILPSLLRLASVDDITLKAFRSISWLEGLYSYGNDELRHKIERTDKYNIERYRQEKGFRLMLDVLSSNYSTKTNKELIYLLNSCGSNHLSRLALVEELKHRQDHPPVIKSQKKNSKRIKNLILSYNELLKFFDCDACIETELFEEEFPGLIQKLKDNYNFLVSIKNRCFINSTLLSAILITGDDLSYDYIDELLPPIVAKENKYKYFIEYGIADPLFYRLNTCQYNEKKVGSVRMCGDWTKVKNQFRLRDAVMTGISYFSEETVRREETWNRETYAIKGLVHNYYICFNLNWRLNYFGISVPEQEKNEFLKFVEEFIKTRIGQSYFRYFKKQWEKAAKI